MMINPFDKHMRVIAQLSKGHVVCPFCYTVNIEPDNFLGLDLDIGRPIYTVQFKEDISNVFILYISEHDDVQIPLGVSACVCPNCGCKYFMLTTETDVTTYRYACELNLLNHN